MILAPPSGRRPGADAPPPAPPPLATPLRCSKLEVFFRNLEKMTYDSEFYTVLHPLKDRNQYL